jgi:Rod binding domain-containing protein
MPLEQLAASSQLSEEEKIAGMSRHFEAILLRQFLNEAQKPILDPKGGLTGAANDIYKDMIVNVLGDEISKSGNFGLAKFFQAQMSFAGTTKAAQDDGTDSGT